MFHKCYKTRKQSKKTLLKNVKTKVKNWCINYREVDKVR